MLILAVTKTPTKYSISMKLNNGQGADGNTKYLSVSLGSLSVDGYGASLGPDKAFAIVELLEPCFLLTLSKVQESATSELASDE